MLLATISEVERDNHDLLASKKGADRANQEIVQAQLRADSDLAEYWLQRNDTQQARLAAYWGGADLARLTPAANAPHNSECSMKPKRSDGRNSRNAWASRRPSSTKDAKAASVKRGGVSSCACCHTGSIEHSSLPILICSSSGVHNCLKRGRRVRASW